MVVKIGYCDYITLVDKHTRLTGCHVIPGSAKKSLCIEPMIEFSHAMQVNHSPSFGIDTPFDLALKTKLVLETLALVSPPWSVAALISNRFFHSASVSPVLAETKQSSRHVPPSQF